MQRSHEKYIEQCLQLARKAKQSGYTAVGSLVVRNDEIVGEGVEGSRDLPSPLAHAEVLAILEAVSTLTTKDLSDCILYTTVEPCFMCSYLIRETKIKCVVFGVEAGEIGGAGSKYPILSASDIGQWSSAPLIQGGVLKKECWNLLKEKHER